MEWGDYNVVYPTKSVPPTTYIIALEDTLSQPYFGGTLITAQFVKNIVNGTISSTGYDDSQNVKRFSDITSAVNWIQANGITFIGSGLIVLAD